MIIIPAGDKTPLVAAYVAEKTGDAFTPDEYQAMAILDEDGTFQGGVVFSKYNGHDCYLSCATENPAAWRDPVPNGIFDYVFNQLECVRCTALIKKSNRKSRALVEGLGFVLEGNIRKGYEGSKDVMLYGLLAEECRYIQEVGDGQEPEADAAVAPATAAETVEATTSLSDEYVGPTERNKALEFW